MSRVRHPVEPPAPRLARRARHAGMFALVVAVLVLASTEPARADALSDLEKAHNAYVAHKYDDAETRLRALLDPRTGSLKDPDNIADARMYLGACLVAQGKKAEAASVFEQLLRDKPDYQPDSLRVTLQATDAFIDARSRMREELAAILAERVRQEQEAKAKVEAERERAAMRLAMLEKLAGEETIVQRNSRWIAALPFGTGQFQNGQVTLGWSFFTAEAVLVAGTAVSAVAALYNNGQVNDAIARGDAVTAKGYQRYATEAFVTGNVLAAGFVVTALAGIIQAQSAFVPEQVVQVRQRPLPPISSLAPLVAPAPSAGNGRGGEGALFGLSGRF